MSYRTIDGAEPNDAAIAALTQILPAGEVPLAGARTMHFEFGFQKTGDATLLVTTERLIVAKDKLFGKIKPAVSIDLMDLSSTGFGPLYGTGPTWEVHFRTTRDELGIMYFLGPTEAEAFKNALHGAARASLNGGAESVGGASSDDAAFHARLQRLHDVVDDLRPTAGPSDLGRPFGEGYGLEEARRAVFSRLEGTDDARQCGGIMAVELVANTKSEDDVLAMMALMGANLEALEQHRLTPEARTAVEGLAGAAHTFLGQFEGPGNMWDLWSRNDEVVVEFLCWHTVARLRMATAGRMPAVERPR